MQIKNMKEKHLNISQKIIFYVYLVISPILIVITTFVLISTYNDTRNKQIEADSNLVKSLDNSIAVIQKELSDLSVYICINDDIANILTSSSAEQLNADTRLWYNYAPMKIIEDITAVKGNIVTMAIYPENGVRPYVRCMDSSVPLSSIEEVRKLEVYQEAVQNRGEVIWKRVEKGKKEIYQTNYGDKIVMYREIFNISRTEQRGFLVFGINEEKFTELYKAAIQSDNEGIVVLNYKGDELMRYGTVDSEILSYIKSLEYLSTNYKKRDTYFEKDGYYVYCSQQLRRGNIVCKMVPKGNIESQLRSIFLTPIAILLGLLIGLWPLLNLISYIISGPLKRLCVAMEEFQKGDFSKQVEVTSHDEIGEVTACFNQMVMSIKELIDNNYVMALREKESELTALQAQINPHFLYNTLDSLYWRIQNDGNEELAEDILVLSQLFRLVLGQGKGIIPVQMERDLIANYLHIQKMRFGRRLNYEINMDKEIMEASIPKLILQPFVENAIVHGFENTEFGGSLLVTGKGQGDNLIFTIEDNGVGMSDDQIEAIWNAQDSKKYSGQRIGRYAIKNVKERLALKYQNNFKLTIESVIGKGTTVTIIIPWEKQGERENGC